MASTKHLQVPIKPVVPSAEKCSEVAYHTQGLYYGPIPVENFLESFLPYGDPNYQRTMPDEYEQRREKLINMAKKSPEPEMYPPFVEALRDWPPEDDGRRKMRFEYRDVHSYQDPKCADLTVDVAIANYATESLWPDKKLIRFLEHETHVEFKPDITHDPFVDLKNKGNSEQEEALVVENGLYQEAVGLTQDGAERTGVEGTTQPQIHGVAEESSAGQPSRARFRDWLDCGFENRTQNGISCRGQIAYYAAAAMTVQYRHSFFQLVILGSCARFIRWDRSCAIVSRRFSYVEEPDLIFDFYRRLAQLDPLSRGYDPEITYATTEEANLARKKFKGFLPDGWHGRLELPSKLPNSDIGDQRFLTLTTVAPLEDAQMASTPIASASTPSSPSTRKVKFVICAPVFHPDSYTPFGRSTQRSLALRLDGDNDKICFMKHFHSQNYKTTLKESDVYKRLQKKRRTDGANFPRGFCTMITGGDVAGTESIGHLYWQKPWIHSKLRPPLRLIVHRIFLKEVGRSIRTFTNCKTMLICVADAMEAHSYLLHELRILHRDISPGNILMERHPETAGGKVRRGYLIDFDHALDLTTDPQPSDCVGTFQFLSAGLLSDRLTIHSGIDDRESCLYTIVYLSMLHLEHEHSGDPVRLHDDLNRLFEDTSGVNKRDALRQCMLGKYGWANQNLKDTVVALSDIFYWRYNKTKDEPTLVVLKETLGDVPGLATVEQALETARQKNIQLLEDKNWLHGTIREHVAKMPDPLEEIEFKVNEHFSQFTVPWMQMAPSTVNSLNRLGLDGRLNVSRNKRQKIE